MKVVYSKLWHCNFMLQGWTKGFVYINGYNLGRFWNEGPQQTLFVPGPYLRQGFNEVGYTDNPYIVK